MADPFQVDATPRVPAALHPLLNERRFVVWRWEERDGKRTKVPYRPGGRRAHASTSDPATWGTFQDAAASAPPLSEGGIGLVLTDHPTLCAFDLDDCRDPVTGQLAPWANHLVDAAGSYTEVTPSGTGLRIIGTVSEGVPAEHSKRPTESGGSIEVYRRATRYITLSFDAVPGTEDRLADVGALVDVVQALYGGANKPAPSGAVDMSATSFEDIETAVVALPNELRECIEIGVPQGGRSGAFLWAVCELAERGWLAGDIIAALDANPAGIAEKYDGRLAAEVARVFGKWKADHPDAADEFDVIESLVGEPAHADVFPALSLADCLAAQQQPARWRIERWLPESGLVVIFGPSNAFKSFIAIDMALCIANGMPWHGHRIAQGPVLYLALEGGAGVVRQRVPGWHRHHNRLDADPPFRVITVPVTLSKAADAEKLRRTADACFGEPPALICVDVLKRSMRGCCRIPGDNRSGSFRPGIAA